MLRGVELDNEIFRLQQRKDLTKEQRELLLEADVAYLQDREDDANLLLNHIMAIDAFGIAVMEEITVTTEREE